MNLEDYYVIERDYSEYDGPNQFLTRGDINEEDDANGLGGNILLFSSKVMAQEFIDFLQNKKIYNGQYFRERFGNNPDKFGGEELEITKLSSGLYIIDPDLSSVWFD